MICHTHTLPDIFCISDSPVTVSRTLNFVRAEANVLREQANQFSGRLFLICPSSRALGAFAKLRRAPISFVMSVCSPVCMGKLNTVWTSTTLINGILKYVFPEDVSSAITLYTSVKWQNEVRVSFWDLPQAIILSCMLTGWLSGWLPWLLAERLIVSHTISAFCFLFSPSCFTCFNSCGWRPRPEKCLLTKRKN